MDVLKRKSFWRRALIMLISMALIICYVPAGTAYGDTDSDETVSVQLEEGTYVPGQVVVMFREGAVVSNDISIAEARELPRISKGFGRELNSTRSESDAAAAASGQAKILGSSLGDGFMIEDTLIFPEAAEDDSIASERLNTKGITSKGVSRAAVTNGLNISLVSSDTYTTEEMIEILSKDPRVAIVEPNYTYEFTDYADYDLDDAYASYLYNVNTPFANNTSGDSASWRDPQPENPADVISTNAGGAWAKYDGTEEVVVAVVDTGINVNHEDLKNMLWENPGDIGLQGEHGYNMGEKNTDLVDNEGHGTHCAGIIAAEANNGLGVAGIASKTNVKIMVLKTAAETEESMQLFTAMGSFNYVLRAKQRGVNVVATSNSWGRSDTQSALFNEIVDRMGEAGILTFVAAGNSNKDLDKAVDNPASNESEFGVTVGAGGITGEKAGFSNYGRTYVDIFAPGVNILSTVGYKCYFPNLYNADKLNATTEFYGYFPEGSLKEDGTVEPAVPEGADEVKPIGAPVFVEQLNPYRIEGDAPEAKATIEYSIDRDHYFTTGEDPTSLKVTIKDAQYGFDYYFFFPYEKNEGIAEENTWYSIYYRTGDTPREFSCEIMGGEIVQDPETGECTTNGVQLAHGLSPANKYVDTHLFGFVKPSGQADEWAPQIEGTDGIGIIITPTETAGNKWVDGESHDLTFYMDSVGVSCQDPIFGRNESYEMMSGTSMACPAAAGACAVIAALYPKDEDQTGAEYAREIRARFFSCAHQTEELKDLCSTGGYVDLSLLEDPNPAITDAVLDSEADTITLLGMGLEDGAEVSYRRIAQEGTEPVSIPSGDMTVSYSEDGKSLVINDARELFGTYTEFTVSCNGKSGSGKFYLVKGLKTLDMVAEHYSKNPAEEDYVNETTPHIFTNADGSKLFAIDNRQGTVSRFLDDQFVDIKGTKLKDAFSEYMDYDEYQSTNCLYLFINEYRKPLVENNKLYLPFGYTFDDGVDYENDQLMAVMDLSADQPSWTFRPFINPVDTDFGWRSFTYEIMGDKLYALGGPTGASDKNSQLLSFDLSDENAEWQLEAEVPAKIVMPLLTEYNGRLYAMLGAKNVGEDITFEEMLNDKVYCFDGTSWTESGSLKYGGKYSGMHFPEIDKYCAEAADGLIFMDTFVDGAGNFFLYDPEQDKITPLDVTITFSNSDDAFFGSSSCAATRDGIYYMRDHSTEMRRGWGLWLLPASEFNSKFPEGELNPSTIEGIKVTLSETSFVYDGEEKKPDVVSVTLDGKTLVEGRDYTISYEEGCVEPGTYTVTVTGIGDYKGTVEATYEIKARIGWIKEDGYWYYYEKDGTMAVNTWKKDSKGWCYLGEDGRMITDDWAPDSKGMCRIGPDGYMVEKTQWIQVDDDWYYIQNGYRAENTWKKDSKGWCYLGEDGKMITDGWAKDSKGWCWMGSDGYMMEKTQWIQVGDDWYYIQNGYRAENIWKKDSQGWCYLGEDGKMITEGWAKDSKGWCWMGSDGYMMEKTQWIQVDDDWYYIQNGYRVENTWKKDSQGWCYLGEDGKMITDGWAKDSQGWCWIGENGYMIEKDMWIGPEGQAGSSYIIKGYRVDFKTITIDGEKYTFDGDGKLVP